MVAGRVLERIADIRPQILVTLDAGGGGTPTMRRRDVGLVLP